MKKSVVILLLLLSVSGYGQDQPSYDRKLKTHIGNLLPDTIPSVDSLREDLSKHTVVYDSIKSATDEKLSAIDTIQEKMVSSISKFEATVEEISGSKVSVPAADLPQINTPELLPGNPVNVSGIDTQLDVSDRMSSSLGDVKNALPEFPSVPDLPAMDGENLTNLGETNGLDGEFSEADKLRRYHDPDVAKEEAMNKIKVQAVNYFAGHDNELKTALDKFSEVKSKIPDPDGVIDMFGKNKSQSDSVSFSERLVFGVTIQMQRDKEFLIDLNPSASIKIRHRWQLGLGWNQRWALKADNPLFRTDVQIYGPRTFTEFSLKKQLSLRTEIEYLKAMTVTQPGLIESQEKKWVMNINAGIKKSFQLSEKISGNFQVMYNISEISRQHVYFNKLNARIGFDFDRIFTQSKGTKNN